MKVYHISPKKLRKNILKEGLKPTLGPRSKRFGEIEPKLFFTKNIEHSMKLSNNLRFNRHPDFTNGIDIWEVKLSDKIRIENDSKFENGFYTREIVGSLDLELVKTFEWMDEKTP
jgi:hypothetical protein